MLDLISTARGECGGDGAVGADPHLLTPGFVPKAKRAWVDSKTQRRTTAGVRRVRRLAPDRLCRFNRFHRF